MKERISKSFGPDAGTLPQLYITKGDSSDRRICNPSAWRSCKRGSDVTLQACHRKSLRTKTRTCFSDFTS